MSADDLLELMRNPDHDSWKLLRADILEAFIDADRPDAPFRPEYCRRMAEQFAARIAALAKLEG